MEYPEGKAVADESRNWSDYLRQFVAAKRRP
jgi:hypothetical protein